jgi:hypothetical protein
MADNTKLPDPGASINAPILRSDFITADPTVNILGVKIRLGGEHADGGPVTPTNRLPTTDSGDVVTSIPTGAARQKLVSAGVSPLDAQAATRMVTVKAHSSNTGNVYVGGSDVSTSMGFELGPGESLSLPVDDAQRIYVTASPGGQKIRVIAI